MRRFPSLSRLALRATLLDGKPGRRALASLLDRVDFDNARIGVWRLSPLLEARAKAHDAYLDLARAATLQRRGPKG